MRHSKFPRWPLLLACWAVTLSGCATPEPEVEIVVPVPDLFSLDEAPNLLLITVDTLRADRLSIYGGTGVETPTFQLLASQGFLFEQAVTPVPLTLPAHTSLLTGKLPPNHGVRDNELFRLDESVTTLAEILQQRGYRTGAFISSFFLDRRYGLAQGFDVYNDRAEAEGDGPDFSERRGEDTAQQAIVWIFDELAQGPFFCWIHLFDPHHPYDPPEPFKSRNPESRYDGEIAYADEIIGKVLSTLATQGRLANTLAVITADHGEGLGDHGEPTHGLALHDTTVRVPLVLLGPKIPRAGRSAAQAGLIDILPTVLDWIGINPPADIDGRSLRPAMEGAALEYRPAYLETTTGFFLYNAPPLFGMRTPKLKYVRGREEELFDLRADPGETTNRIETIADAGRRLIASLDTMLAGIEQLPAHGDAGGGDPEGDFRPGALHELAGLMASAQNHFELGRSKEGRETLNAVLDRYPGNVEALRLLADDDLRNGNNQRALETYERARSLSRVPNPRVDLNRVLCLAALGRRAEALGRRAEALQAVDEFLASQPNHPDALELASGLMR